MAAAACIIGFAVLARAQVPTSPPPAAADRELAVKDEAVTFRSRVNLILVPVIVRDKSGKATGDLHQEDFLVTDNGKPQSIIKFSVEKAGVHAARPPAQPAENAPGEEARPAAVVPERFTAFLVDDIHIDFADLARVRDAILRHIDSSLKPTDRMAVFTTSGVGAQDFTDDRDVLKQALMKVQPRPIARSIGQECPDISYYAADLIENRHDQLASQAITTMTMGCMQLTGPGAAATAAGIVESTAQRVLRAGEQETRISLVVIKDVIRRMSAVPGHRNLVLASPGMLVLSPEVFEKGELIDRAIRANVVINSLDARGLYVDPSLEASRPNVAGGIEVSRVIDRLMRESAAVEGDVLAELSHGTGGSFFENGNDFDAALRRLAGQPDYVYMLAFSPQNLKVDGRFHSLKVRLKEGKGLNVQARKGYYAPKSDVNAEENARVEIEEALFSREELRDIPLNFQTQFFKRDEFNARLSVLSKVDVRQLRFRKADGRNFDDLTVITALFDRNGNMVQAIRHLVQMKLLDETVATKLGSGVTLRTGFDVHPGAYAIRVVVRDKEGQLMSAANGAVEIP